MPLDPSYPKERLALILEDANVSVLLTQEGLMGELPQHKGQIICFDSDWKSFDNSKSHNSVIDVKPENAAYVIYTSGSTGKPKGVVISHHAVVNFLSAMQHSPGLTQQDILLAVTTISFDIAVLELYLPLMVGARIVLVSREVASDGVRLLERLNNSSASVMQATPATWRLLLRALGQSHFSLKKIFVGGEALPRQLAHQLLEKGNEVWNLYGPTETTVWSASYPVATAPVEGLTCDTQESIGCPIANTQIYILDHYRQPVPIGVPGELHIGGAGLARGYLNRPELTEERFIPNPFSDDPQARLYKTGDLARYLPDGNIEYLGRLDHQVKIRGFRIELGEIEALLSQHPNVQETAIIVKEYQPGDKRLVAYITSDLIPDRIPYQSDCLVEWDEKSLALRTEDISSSGICLQQDTTTTLKPDQEIRLRLQLPNESEVRWLQGKVAWSRTSWAGIELILTPEEQTRLARGVEFLLEEQGLLKIVQRLLVGNLRHYLEEKLPNYMVPAHFVLLTALPLTPNGKVDRRALPAPEYQASSVKKDFLPQTEIENEIAAVWQEVLQIKKVGIYDHFFEIGGHSLLIAQVQSKLQDSLGQQITMVELFEHPTIHALAEHLSDKKAKPLSTQPEPQNRVHTRTLSNEIAIIGMAGRFPGANDIEAFWQNLQDGVESITFFSDAELKTAGIDAATLNQPHYVKAGGVLSDVEQFDAAFFDFSPKEAEMTDPQHRLFLECAWQAIEHAGIEPGTDESAIGVYAGVGMNTYLLNNLSPNPQFSDSVDHYQLMIGNGNDFLPTRVSYKLNLKGPSVNVQTACSTSLVAVHTACQSLLDGECDVALAGGVSIRVPHKAGYLYQEGMIMSPDGHCRAFDANAQGTVGGNGAGVVVLKRLEDALADGDCIHAIIKGSAINNDGSVKVGYTAPSVEGQAAVIAEAQANAGVKADTISYIETHGTGTKLGDPIEMAALNKAFQAHTQKQGFCAIGSVKTNIGHTDAAAGVAGLIKTVQALKHQCLPPSLHFEHPNPQIDFANSPFYVNNTRSEWQTINGTPRRAGVSSFGIGGTNAHLVLEEAPTPQSSSESRSWQLLVLSAKTESALETATGNLATYLEQHPENNLADVAYTLSKGRKAFSHRRVLMAQNTDEAVRALHSLDPTSVFTHSQASKDQPVVFMFSGQGSQYVNMGLELYQTEPSFREEIDRCSAYLKPHLELDLRQILYPSEEHILEAEQQLKQTAIAQPALFVIDYALAKLWMSWGVQPDAMIGHSLGEYVAACLSGVFSLEEALSLVAARGQLMQQLPQGAMLSVSLSEAEVQPLLGQELALAAINAPDQCVVSGITEAVEALENQLTQKDIACRRLQTSHAFHSQMMAPILASFTKLVKQVRLCPPQIPYLSNVSGNWITVEETLDHSYWANHLRHTVHFAEGMQQLLKNPRQILLEIGPGRTLTTLARRHPEKATEQVVLSSLRHPKDQQSDEVFLLNTLGKLWLAGRQINWSGFYANEHRHRLPLPTYPFERQGYWIAPPTQDAQIPQAVSINEKTDIAKKPDIADWFYLPFWKPSVLSTRENGNLASCLVFEDACGLGSKLVKKLEQQGINVITVKVGAAFTKQSDHDYTLNPQLDSDYDALIKELHTGKQMPQTIVHLWCVTNAHQESTIEGVDKAQELGFYSLLFLAQALGKQNVTDEIQISVVSNNMQAVTGEEALHPEKATVLGPVKVIGQEYPNLKCRSIDIVTQSHDHLEDKLIDQLEAELSTKAADQVIAYRGQHRWVQTFEPVRLEKPINKTPQLREKGVYLITGGLGGIGLTLAEHLAKTVQAKLVLTGRSAFPAKAEWHDWLTTHDEHDDVSRKIRKVQALEAQGAEVWVASADVALLPQMQAVITMAEERFGQLNGVIHAAGIISQNSFSVIEQTGKTDCEQQFLPKVHGTLVLEKVLQDRKLDFCLLLSSLSSVLGGLGFVAYSGANLFMDAFAHQHNQNPSRVPWISVNWDGWRFENDTKPSISVGAALTELAITPEEGVNAFQRILSAGSQVNQFVVSTGDLPVRFEQWIKREAKKRRAHSQKDESSSRYSRPNLPTSFVAPRTQLEQTLANLWQNILGIEQIGIHDDFFELGGDSLIAVQLIAKLRENLQMAFSAHSLLNAPTIATLAELIEQTIPMQEGANTTPQQTLPSSLVEIKTGNSLKPPLFLVHPVGGHVYFYRDLAHHLGSERPVYGIQAQGGDGEMEPLTQVEEMATHYIEAMRVRQPEGPYFIGGSSFGGTVAFEMAQQLHALGQKVALLTMMDTPGPHQMPAKLETDEEILAYTLNVGANASVSLEELRKLEPEEQLRYSLEKQKEMKNPLQPDLDSTQVRHLLQIFKANAQAMSKYQPQAYHDQIIFFRAKEKDAYNAKTPERAWIDLAQKGVKVFDVPGNHFTMHSPPHVQVMAEQLRPYLA